MGDPSLYIGRLPRMIQPEVINQALADRDVFVKHIDMKDHFAFVHLQESSLSAQEALERLKDLSIDGQSVIVELPRGNGTVKRREEARRSHPAKENDTLFIVGFAPTVTESELRNLIEEHAPIKNFVLSPRHFSHVQFQSVEDARNVFEKLHNSKVRLKLRYAYKERERHYSPNYRDSSSRRRDDPYYRDSYHERRNYPRHNDYRHEDRDRYSDRHYEDRRERRYESDRHGHY